MQIEHDAFTFILTWLHLFFAIGWLGSAMLMTFALTPSLRRMTPQTVAEFNAGFMPLVTKLMLVFSTMTLAMGFGLLYSISGGRILPMLDGGTWGDFMTGGITFAVTVYVFALVVILPMQKKLGALIMGSGDRNVYGRLKIAKLTATMEMMVLVDFVLLILAFTLMAGAASYS